MGSSKVDAAEDEKKPEEKLETIAPKRLFEYADSNDKVMTVVASVVALAQGAALPVFTVILGDATDMMGSPAAQDETFASKMAGPLRDMAILMVFLGASATVQSTLLHRCAERQGARIRLAYLTSALQRDQAWFDVNDGSALPTRMQTEVQKVQDAIGQKFGLMLVPLGQLLAGLIVGMIYGWKLTLVILCLFPLMGLSGFLLTSAATEEANQPWYARAGAVAEEVIFAIRTVAAFGGEPREIARYEGNLTEAMYGSIRAGIKNGFAFGWLFMVFGLSYGLAFWFSAHFMMGPDGDFDTGGDVILCFFSAIIGVSGVSDAAMPMNTFMAGLAAGTNMFKVIDEKSTIEHSGEDGNVTGLDVINEIKLEKVNFFYPSRPEVKVLDALSLSITKSQKVAFVGESGSGKSTIVQLMERFYDPAAGSIKINDISLTTIPVYAWRRRVGYVGQEPVLFATSIMENIRMGVPDATEQDCRSAAEKAEALEFIDKQPNGINTYVGQGGGQMSGGQKQRIAIARALVKKPILLILDEATSALDNESEKLVQATLDGLQQHGELMIVTIAHRLSTVRNSDKIFVLSQGALVESGTHTELVEKKGVYFKLTESQASADGVGADGNKPDAGLEKNEADVKQGENKDENAKQEEAGKKEEKTEEEIEKERLKELEKWNPSMSRILTFADPIVKAMMPIAVLICMVEGAVMPLQGWFLSKAMFDFFLPYECPPPDEDPIVQYQCDEYEPKGEKSPLIREAEINALIFLILAVVQFLGITGKQGLYRWIQERMTKSLRKTYLQAILSKDIGFFDDPANSSGGLTAALAKQTQLIAGITGISLGQMVGSLCGLSMGIFLSFWACWRLALAMLGVVPIIFASMAFIMKLMYGNEGTGDGGAYSEVGAVASEAVLNIRTVRACRAEKQVLSNFSEKVNVVLKKKSSESVKSGFAYGFGMAIFFVLYIIVFWYGPFCVDEGFCDGEEMFKALFAMMFGAMGAGMGAIFMQDGNKAKLAAYDMFAILDRESKVDAMNPSGAKAVQETKPYIQFKGVEFFYPHRPEVQVLKNFSVDVYPGQTVALVGPSGSGKSTIVQLLQRFYDPQVGSLLVGNTELRTLDIKWWRSTMGFVGQEPVLFDATIEENVKYGKPDATRTELEEAAALANMDFVINGKATWDDNVGSKGGKLSGGQKQRVAIARALLRKPTLLLLDEATSALDSASELVVQQALDKAREGRTTIVIAHRLSTIQDSDNILVMCDGTVTEHGTHDELLAKKGLYFTLQQKSAA
eukprot:gnl/MRDRNA2_/MRDRNA2_105825_c0_seq1.p1 gnl/MRDRNA2_/MRDRNA2_105825_c0~~gnl/MRDRNA2_/MRDRNA2_105825_c0_seq1.p1  ORF type:complete len:1270 (-),score=303.55 gnl/MRDRNA2_/MRDRNA2_105825_c0_seq1:59-3868(-)